MKKTSFILALVLLGAAGFYGIQFTAATTGPSQDPGVGSGSIATDASNNISIGTDTFPEGVRLYVVGASGATTTLRADGYIYSASGTVPGGFIFPDGTIQTTAGGGTNSAANVSSGDFGANTGGGNYSFPSKLGIGTTTPSYSLAIHTTLTSGGGILLRDSSSNAISPVISVIAERTGPNNSQAFSGGLALARLNSGGKSNPDSVGGTIYFGENHTDGSEGNILYGASISGIAEDYFDSSSDMPMGIAFYTGTSGTALGTANVSYGTEAMRISSGGSVGIGTSGPDKKFHVLESSSGTGQARLQQSSTGDAALAFTLTGAQEFYVGLDNSDSDKFKISDSSALGTNDRLVIDSSGNVGIGTSTPSAQLHVSADARFGIGSDYIQLSHNKTNGVITTGSGKLNLNSASREVVVNGTSGSDYLLTVGDSAESDTYGILSLAYGPTAIAINALTGNSGSSTAVQASVSGPNSWAVRGEAGGTGSIGVYGSGPSGGYDFYAAGAGTNYGSFTGAHDVMLDAGFPHEAKPGMVVSATGRAEIRKDETGQTSLSATLPTVRVSNINNDPAVFGVLINETEGGPDWYSPKTGDRFGIVNALGEGRVLVTNRNGEVKAGDYLTTSPVPGYAERQDDDLLHSYTLGKAIETVDWNSVTETVEFGGQTYKAYLLAVVYTSG